MLQFCAFGRLLVALALCSAAFAASATPASAKSHHGARRYAHAHYPRVHTRRHYAHRYRRHFARASHWERGVAQMQARNLDRANASISWSAFSGGMTTSAGFGSSNIVAEARRYLGGNPTDRSSL